MGLTKACPTSAVRLILPLAPHLLADERDLAVLDVQHHLPRSIVVLELHHPRPELPRRDILSERRALQERRVQHRLGARHGERLVPRPPPDRDPGDDRGRPDRPRHPLGAPPLHLLPRRARKAGQEPAVLVGVRGRSAANGAGQPVRLLPVLEAATRRRVLRPSTRPTPRTPAPIDTQQTLSRLAVLPSPSLVVPLRNQLYTL